MYFPSEGSGGGSRARISARLGAGVDAEVDVSDWMAFMMNQLFLFLDSIDFVFSFVVGGLSGASRDDWWEGGFEDEVETELGRLVVRDRYQPEREFPKDSMVLLGILDGPAVAELQSSYEMVAGTN